MSELILGVNGEEIQSFHMGGSISLSYEGEEHTYSEEEHICRLKASLERILDKDSERLFPMLKIKNKIFAVYPYGILREALHCIAPGGTWPDPLIKKGDSLLNPAREEFASYLLGREKEITRVIGTFFATSEYGKLHSIVDFHQRNLE